MKRERKNMFPRKRDDEKDNKDYVKNIKKSVYRVRIIKHDFKFKPMSKF